MVGESQPMQAIQDYIRKVALTDSHVLITGETGTGKELVAAQI
jgi:DNA-binding NtrC family response regulator